MKGLWELPPHSLLVTPFVKNAPLMAYSLVQFVGGGFGFVYLGATQNGVHLCQEQGG